MQINSIFPTAVAKFNLGRDFTAEELAFINWQPTYKNLGNTTSNDRYILNHATAIKIREFVESCVDQYLKSIYAPANEVSLRITQSWLNYTKAGEHHHRHAHPNSFISGVLYIKADNGKDKIHFHKDGYQQIKLSVKDYNLYNSESWWFPVSAGELMLFPSSLTHMVEPVEGEERISLAFNTFPVGYLGQEESLTALRL